MSARVIRVATWNIHGLRGGVDAVAAVVRGEAVDVLLLQESGPRRRIRALGAALGMVVCGDPRSFPRRRIQNAVLVRPPRAVRSHALDRFHGGSLLSPRGALVAVLDDLIAVSVHLGMAGPERARHIEELLELVDGAEGPLVVGGDLNAHPEDAVPIAIARRYPDAWERARDGEDPGNTFPSDEPVARIDYLFAGSALRPLRAWTAGGTVSDHLMVIADLELG